MSAWNDDSSIDLVEEDDLSSFLPRRKEKQDGELDITPMIDVTFLLLIFFLVASVPDAQTAVELPPARHGVGVSSRESLIFTVASTGENSPAATYLADGKVGEPLSGTLPEQEEQIRQAVEIAQNEGKTNVLIKADRGVLHKDVSRVATAVSAVPGIQLYLAVLEKD